MRCCMMYVAVLSCLILLSPSMASDMAWVRPSSGYFSMVHLLLHHGVGLHHAPGLLSQTRFNNHSNSQLDMHT